MSNAIKFSQEELNKIQDLRVRGSKVVTELGQAEAEILMISQQKQSLETIKQQLLDRYIILQQEERQLVRELNQKYGSGTVDVASGEFIPS
jgi:hypothetical protein